MGQDSLCYLVLILPEQIAIYHTRLVQYKMSLKGGVIPTQDEPGGNLGKVD